MTNNSQIHYLIGGDDAQQAEQYRNEAKRLRSLATRKRNKGYESEAKEIQDRADFCARQESTKPCPDC